MGAVPSTAVEGSLGRAQEELAVVDRRPAVAIGVHHAGDGAQGVGRQVGAAQEEADMGLPEEAPAPAREGDDLAQLQDLRPLRHLRLKLVDRHPQRLRDRVAHHVDDAAGLGEDHAVAMEDLDLRGARRGGGKRNDGRLLRRLHGRAGRLERAVLPGLVDAEELAEELVGLLGLGLRHGPAHLVLIEEPDLRLLATLGHVQDAFGRQEVDEVAGDCGLLRSRSSPIAPSLRGRASPRTSSIEGALGSSFTRGPKKARPLRWREISARKSRSRE
jgi:hypothetical protein